MSAEVAVLAPMAAEGAVDTGQAPARMETGRGATGHDGSLLYLNPSLTLRRADGWSILYHGELWILDPGCSWDQKETRTGVGIMYSECGSVLYLPHTASKS